MILNVLAALLVFQVSSFAMAGNGGGHDVPTPFEVKYEWGGLTDGVEYHFSGIILVSEVAEDGIMKPLPWLILDLERYPDLDRRMGRQKWAAYLLKSLPGNQKEWEGKVVSVRALA